MAYLLENNDLCKFLNYYDIEISNTLIQEHLDGIDIYAELDEFEKELIADMRSDEGLEEYRFQKLKREAKSKLSK